MPITKSAKKALRVSLRKRVYNIKRKDAMKSAIITLRKLSLDKKKKEGEAFLSTVYKAIDKAAKRGVIKKNNAAHKKAQAARLVKNIQ